MKLILAIVSNDDSGAVSSALTKRRLLRHKARYYRRLPDGRQHHLHLRCGRRKGR